MIWGTPGFPWVSIGISAQSEAHLDGAVSAATKAEAEELEAAAFHARGTERLGFLRFPEKDVKVVKDLGSM